MLRFDDRVWFFWAVLILLLPMKWIAAATAAVVVHEGCHMASVLLLGGKIRKINVAPFGVLINAEGITGLQELLCVLAGPLGSFGLILMIRRFPLLGLCGLIHGLFNLLPVYPLDGGRALAGLLEYTLPNRAETISKWVERGVLVLLMTVSIYTACRYNLGIFPVCFCIFAILNACMRKRP